VKGVGGTFKGRETLRQVDQERGGENNKSAITSAKKTPQRLRVREKGKRQHHVGKEEKKKKGKKERWLGRGEGKRGTPGFLLEENRRTHPRIPR